MAKDPIYINTFTPVSVSAQQIDPADPESGVTLGIGNQFVELSADEAAELGRWLLFNEEDPA